jgi:HSP20 family protein
MPVDGRLVVTETSTKGVLTMTKNDKTKTVAVKKDPQEQQATAAVPSRMASPMRAVERELDRLFEDFPLFRWPRLRELDRARFPRELRLQAPALDMYEENDDVVIKAEVPGLSKDDIEITLSDSTLTIKGEKKKEEEVKEKDYYRCEREYGSFLRTVELPNEVKAEGARAAFKNGVLEVHLPKSETAKKKEVHVKVQ